MARGVAGKVAGRPPLPWPRTHSILPSLLQPTLTPLDSVRMVYGLRVSPRMGCALASTLAARTGKSVFRV
jgi:hypothetical protein